MNEPDNVASEQIDTSGRTWKRGYSWKLSGLNYRGGSNLSGELTQYSTLFERKTPEAWLREGLIKTPTYFYSDVITVLTLYTQNSELFLQEVPEQVYNEVLEARKIREKLLDKYGFDDPVARVDGFQTLRLACHRQQGVNLELKCYGRIDEAKAHQIQIEDLEEIKKIEVLVEQYDRALGMHLRWLAG